MNKDIPEFDPHTGEPNPLYQQLTGQPNPWKYGMGKQTKFKVGDRAHKIKGYKFPCTIVGVFQTIEGNIRVVGEMDEYGLLHIFNEEQLEHYEQPR